MARRTMSSEHKAALAEGRAQSRAVRAYLQTLQGDGRRGRRISPDDLQARITDLQARIQSEEDPSKRLDLIQQRLDYEGRLADAGDEVDAADLEEAFIKAAAAYSERRGISYPAWRELGVPAVVLKAAGVKRTRRTS